MCSYYCNNNYFKVFNTFGIDAYAFNIIEIYSEVGFLICWKKFNNLNIPILILGECSNVLFVENYCGVILLNRIKGMVVREDYNYWYLHIGSGENWHELVKYTISMNIPGLENLALIPGLVGSAPIQNIGAYGVEFKCFCEYVDVLYLGSGKKRRLTNKECEFGYRDSIFKRKILLNYAIVAVGLKFHKIWDPVLNYDELKSLNINKLTLRKVFNIVCGIRRKKIPDTKVIGHAGSFFKNPIVTMNKVNKILKYYPDIPYYLQSNGMVKILAGWLIDKCHLKGYKYGGAAVYDKQALILINYKRASGIEIAKLASYVQQQVDNKFSIWLEPEVRYIFSYGEKK